MAHAGPTGRRRLAGRHDLAWSGGGLIAAVLGGVFGGLPGALAVGVSVGTTWLLVGRGLRAELVSLDSLVDALGELQDGDLPALAEGDAARAGRALSRAGERARDAEQARDDALLRTTELLDAAPNGIVVVGDDGRVEFANGAARTLLGLTRDPVGMLPVEVLPSAEVNDTLAAAARGAPAGPRDVIRGDLDIAVSAYPMEHGILGILRDVSAERRVERARTDFVANVSHELRTPITAILGYSETLLDTPGLEPDVEKMAATILRNGRRLKQLFEDLLALYKIEARRQELPLEEVRLAPIVGSAVVSAADAASAKGIDFDVDVPEELRALGNREALSAILGNLASNACKYTPSGGSVTVRARADDEGVRVDVVDTGVGIPKAHHERVFERFYRVDEGRSREVGGTGLGLAIVKHLAMASGLRVTLESEEGQGTTFTVWLPRAAPTKPSRTWDVTL